MSATRKSTPLDDQPARLVIVWTVPHSSGNGVPCFTEIPCASVRGADALARHASAHGIRLLQAFAPPIGAVPDEAGAIWVPGIYIWQAYALDALGQSVSFDLSGSEQPARQAFVPSTPRVTTNG